MSDYAFFMYLALFVLIAALLCSFPAIFQTGKRKFFWTGWQFLLLGCGGVLFSLAEFTQVSEAKSSAWLHMVISLIVLLVAIGYLKLYSKE